MASANRPEILLLSLAFREFFDEQYSFLLAHLGSSANLTRVKTASAALQYLDERTPRAIIVTDEGLTQPVNSAVLAKLASYVRSGGLAIFGLHFISFTRLDAFDGFFSGAFGVPWAHGDYQRSDFEFNHACSLPAGAAAGALPQAYSMEVLNVKDAQPHEKIYVPVNGAMTQSPVFPPVYVDQTQAAVVGARVGDGYLVYVGDENPERGSERVIMALCGL